MKKIIAIAVVIALLFSMTACGGGEIPVHTANWGKNDVNETSEYKVTVKLSEGVLDENAPRLVGGGTYTTTITGGSATGFEVTTKLTFVGHYEIKGGANIPVNDIVTSSVTFKDVMYDFKPIKSEKTYKGKTVKFSDGKYSVDDLSYSSVIEYSEKKATVKNTVQGIDETFEIATPSTMFIDNEQLLYVIRSFVKKEGAGISFSLTNGMSTSVIPMSAMISASTIEELSVVINDNPSKMKAYPISVRKASNSETGTQQIIYCAVSDIGKVNNETGGTMSVDRSRVLKIVQAVPYTMDIMEYELVKYTYSENK